MNPDIMSGNNDIDNLSKLFQSPEGQQVFFTLGKTFGETGKLDEAVQKAKEEGDRNGLFIKLGVTAGLILLKAVAKALFEGYISSRRQP